MSPAGLSDLDALVLRCGNPKARSYLAEAVTCLKAGAFRASIVVTWVAVVHDLLSKFEQLSLAGDKNAQKQVDEFHRIVATNDVKGSLDFERTVLDVACKDFEFFGALALVDLTRLREDRHRCAHPSMLDADTDYQPAPEQARCHVVNAVTHLLEHGPAQGKAAMERLMAGLEQSYFPRSVDEMVVHLEHGPLGRPRASLVRNYVVVLLKRYFEEAPVPVAQLLEELRLQAAREKRERRILRTLQAVVRLHRVYALGALQEKLDGLVAQATDGRLGALLVLVCEVADAWHSLSQAQRNRAERFVRAMPATQLPVVMKAAWSIPHLRTAAMERCSRLHVAGWAALSKTVDPPREWVQMALEEMASAKSWSDANCPKEFLVAAVELISEQQVESLLTAAKDNEILATSWGVKDMLSGLARSPSFGPARLKALVQAADLESAYSGQTWWPAESKSVSTEV